MKKEMETCRVCGEQKPELEFTKLKHFHKVHPPDAIWCKKCQKMYIEMKREEKRKEEFLAIPFVARVEFT